MYFNSINFIEFYFCRVKFCTKVWKFCSYFKIFIHWNLLLKILFASERMHCLHPSQGQQQKPPDCLPAALLPWGYPTGCWGPGVSWWARGSSTCRSTDSTATCWSRHTTRHDTTRTRDTPPVSRDWLSGISGTSYLLPPPPPPRLSCFSILLYSTLPCYFGTAFINGGRRRHHSVLVKRQSKLSVGCLVAFV